MATLTIDSDILTNISILAEDETMMKRVAKYLRKLVAQKEDTTLMTKEEFFARIDNARKQTGKQFANVEELDKYIRNL